MILGVDVSHWQGDINWSKCAGQGVKFAIVKASEGASVTDPDFGRNVEGALNNGLVVGAYHFLNAGIPAKTQVDYFALAMGSYLPMLQIPLVLDCEANDQYSKKTITLIVRDFCNEIHARYGYYPLIYTSKTWWEAHINSEMGDWKQAPLWIAHHGAAQPAIPKDWKGQEYWLWQFGKEPGSKYGASSTEIDVNRWNPNVPFPPGGPPPPPPEEKLKLHIEAEYAGYKFSGDFEIDPSEVA